MKKLLLLVMMTVFIYSCSNDCPTCPDKDNIIYNHYEKDIADGLKVICIDKKIEIPQYNSEYIETCREICQTLSGFVIDYDVKSKIIDKYPDKLFTVYIHLSKYATYYVQLFGKNQYMFLGNGEYDPNIIKNRNICYYTDVKDGIKRVVVMTITDFKE